MQDNKATILCLKGDVLDKSKKLKKARNHTMEQSDKVSKLEEELKKAQEVDREAKATTNSLKKQMS